MSFHSTFGQDIYDLLYTHYDKNGCLIEDVEEVFHCPEEDIDEGRLSALEALLIPITTAKDVFLAVEAAKLLSAWGSEKAIEYFDYCIDERIDRLCNLYPHRLHARYDTTYEQIVDSLFNYHSRNSERDYAIFNTYHGFFEKKARERISAPLTKVIRLSKVLVLDMGYLIRVLMRENWKEYLPVLKDCYLDFMSRPDHDLNRKWNLPILDELLKAWDPDFFIKTN